MLINDVETNWLAQTYPSIIGLIIFYLVGLVVFYLIIKKAVSAGTKEQRRLAATTNNLLRELLKLHGADSGNTEEITRHK